MATVKSKRPVQAFIDIAITQIGVKEQKGNKGPKIAEYLAVVGLSEGYAWCAGFVCWCVTQTCNQLGIKTTMKFSAGVLAMWNQNKELRVTEPIPGDVFVMDFGLGKGHTGIVTEVRKTSIVTIEGNTNYEGGREGDGVYSKVRPKSAIKGYLRPFK